MSLRKFLRDAFARWMSVDGARAIPGDRAPLPSFITKQEPDRPGRGGLFLLAFGLIGAAILGIFWLLTRGV